MLFWVLLLHFFVSQSKTMEILSLCWDGPHLHLPTFSLSLSHFIPFSIFLSLSFSVSFLPLFLSLFSFSLCLFLAFISQSISFSRCLSFLYISLYCLSLSVCLSVSISFSLILVCRFIHRSTLPFVICQSNFCTLYFILSIFSQFISTLAFVFPAFLSLCISLSFLSLCIFLYLSLSHTRTNTYSLHFKFTMLLRLYYVTLKLQLVFSPLSSS